MAAVVRRPVEDVGINREYVGNGTCAHKLAESWCDKIVLGRLDLSVRPGRTSNLALTRGFFHFVCLPQNLVTITTPAHLLKGGLRPYSFIFGIVYFFTATAFINAWDIDWRLARRQVFLAVAF